MFIKQSERRREENSWVFKGKELREKGKKGRERRWDGVLLTRKQRWRRREENRRVLKGERLSKAGQS